MLLHEDLKKRNRRKLVVRETSLCLGLINLLAAPRDEFGGGTKGKKVSDHTAKIKSL